MSRNGRSIVMGVTPDTVSPAALYQAIADACSQDATLLKSSEERISKMLEMLGTYNALQEIAAQRAAPTAIRQQAMIQLKNSLPNHWRSRKYLSDDYRSQIRQRCFFFIDEEDELIAQCNEIVVSKLARYDYPQTWPNLINDLMEVIDTNLQKRYVLQVESARDTLVLRRSLKLLNGILKEFASIKMPTGIKAMGQIVDQLRTVLYGYYSTMSTTFSSEYLTPQTLSSDTNYTNILLSHLVFKCLVKMTVWLWSRNDRVANASGQHQNQSWVQDCFQNSAIQLRALVTMRKNLVLATLQEGQPQNEPSRNILTLTKHVRLFGKFFRRLQQLSHEKFVSSLPMSNDLVLFYWSQVGEAASCPPNLITDSDGAVYPVRFLVQGMVLFKESISQWSDIKRNGKTPGNTLSQTFVENAARLLITRFMTLNPSDLEDWVSDPEEWMNLEEKENDQWEYEIRPCAERLLVQLCNQFPQFVVPLLKAFFNEYGPQPSMDITAIVGKEAVYCAIGRCANRLKDDIPFEDWLSSNLSMEARSPDPNYPIIKRRIAWMIGKWVHTESASPNNPKIWEVLSYLLSNRAVGTDTVVRLTSAMALRECVDAISFNADVFAPYLPTIIPELVRLMGESDTLESKRKIGASLNVTIEQAGTRIQPFVHTIVEPLPDLWITAGKDLLLKASLLVTVTRLIEAIKEQSMSLSSLVVPLIRESLSPAVAVHLDADALELWVAALRNANSIKATDGSFGLQDIIPEAIALLSTNLDLLGSLINILEAYYLLDASYVLMAYGKPLFEAYLAAFSNKIVEFTARQLLQTLNLLILVTPSQLWGEIMHTSGLFADLLRQLTSGEMDTMVAIEVIAVFSRILTSDRAMFVRLVVASAPALRQTEEVIFDILMDQWWGKFDNISESRHRKLAAMGLAGLVATARPEVLKRLPTEVFNLWLDVLGEIREAVEFSRNNSTLDEAPSPTDLVLYWDLDRAPSPYFRQSEGTLEYERRKVVYQHDPIRTEHLVSYIKQHLQVAESTTGADAFRGYMSQADPAVLEQIQRAMFS